MSKVKVHYEFNKMISFNKDLISVIVPVYNVEKFLDKSLVSLKNQTYENIEVIIVDNGSTDNSYNKCKELISTDNRFKLYHIDSKGSSLARNYGLKKANGKYIYFLDGDDYLDKDIIKVLYDLMISNKVDISIVGYYFTYKNHEKANEHMINTKHYFNKKELLENMMIRGSIGGYTCNKLYKKEFIDNIYFDETIKYHEDMLFNSTYISRINNGVYYTSPYYHYVQREGSMTGKRDFDDTMLTYIYALEKTRKHYQSEGLSTLQIDYEIVKCCCNFKYRISVSKGDYSNSLKIINEINKKYYKELLNNKGLNLVKRLEIIITNKHPVFVCKTKEKLVKIKEKCEGLENIV